MTTITSTSLKSGKFSLRSIATGGIMIGLLHLIIQDGLVFGLLGQTSFIQILQYVTSGVMGLSAFAGGLATALIGLIAHFLFSIIFAGIFLLSVDRIPLLRRNIIFGSILFGIGVFVVMYYVVLPLSAAPPVPLDAMKTIEIAVEHALVIGLALGLYTQRTIKTNLSEN